MKSLAPSAALLGLAVLLAACSSGAGAGSPAPATDAPATEAPATPAEMAPSEDLDYSRNPTPGAAEGGTAEVDLASTALGDILVDGKGMTLYMFTADSAGKSACAGDCLTAWPPLLADTMPTLGDGLDVGDFDSITRDDGTTQLTFFGMPLYYFAGDQAAGDTNGQGVGGKWYVLLADGTVVK